MKKSSLSVVASILVLAASAAAQTPNGAGYAYASVSFQQMGPDLSESALVSYYFSDYGYGSYSATTLVGTDGSSYVYSLLSMDAFQRPTPSFGVGLQAETLNFAVTNSSSTTAESYTVGIYTFGYGLGYSPAAPEYGEGIGEGFFAESYPYEQITLNGATAGNDRVGSAFNEGFYNYDPYNGATGYINYLPNTYPSFAQSYASDYQLYTFTVAPNSSDTFLLQASSYGAAYATPGPIAAAPFLVSLLVRKRRRK